MDDDAAERKASPVLEEDHFSAENADFSRLQSLRSTIAPSTPTSSSAAAARRSSTNVFTSRFTSPSTTLNSRKSRIADNLLTPLSANSAVYGELLGFAVAITMPYSRTGAKPNGMRVLYVICITMLPPPSAAEFTPCKSWEVVKRFSEFTTFDKEVRDILPTHGELADLPSRTLLTSPFEERIVAERRALFLQYLHSVLQLSSKYERLQPVIAKFLGVSAGVSFRAPLDSPTANGAAGNNGNEHGTAFKLGESQNGFVYRLTGQLGGMIKPTYRLCWMLLNTAEGGDLKIYNPEQNTVLLEMPIAGEYGKATACEPRDFGAPAQNAFGFTVWTPQRELILYADTAEDRTMWISALQAMFTTRLPSNAIAAPKPKARPPAEPRPSVIFKRESITRIAASAARPAPVQTTRMQEETS